MAPNHACAGEYNQHAEFCITPIGNGGLLDSENDAASIQIYNTFQSGNPTITVKDKEGMTLEQWSKMPQANGFGYEFR